MSVNQDKRSKAIKIIIIILSVMLAISATLLVGVQLVLPAISTLFAEDSVVTVPNHIGPSSIGVSSIDADSQVGDGGEAIRPSAPVLEFYQGKAEYNKRFEVRNILPGDKMERYYCVRAHHSQDVTLVFSAEVIEQSKNLGDVLDVTVVNSQTDALLCQGSFNGIHNKVFKAILPANSNKLTDTFYLVKVSMDTSVGNAYQEARLLADFHWYIEEPDSLDPGPQTGDSSNIWLWIAVAGIALVLVFFLLFTRRKDDDEEEEDEADE